MRTVAVGEEDAGGKCFCNASTCRFQLLVFFEQTTAVDAFRKNMSYFLEYVKLSNSKCQFTLKKRTTLATPLSLSLSIYSHLSSQLLPTIFYNQWSMQAGAATPCRDQLRETVILRPHPVFLLGKKKGMTSRFHLVF